MNKNRFFTLGLLPVLLAGLFAVVLLGCPTAAPKEDDKNKGGGDDGDKPTEFSVNNEYIDFHSYYGEVSNTVGPSISNVVFVASISPTPNTIGGIDTGARVIRDFNQGETRKISLNWTDTFKTADLFGTDGTTKRTGLVTINNDGDYATNKVDWVLKENTQYYMHIYYNNGANTFTHPFKTPAYPTSTMAADDLFTGGNTGNNFNIEGRPSPMEWRESNPFLASVASYNQNDTIFARINAGNRGGCFNNGPCNSTAGIIIKFFNHTLLTNTDPAFRIIDTALMLPNKPAILNLNLNPNGTRISLVFSYGGLSSTGKITNIVDR